MSSYDDIFEAPAPRREFSDQPFDKDAWGEKKQAERQAVYDLADATAIEVAGDGGKFQAFLDVQARFDRYSVTNALLILTQMPGATKVKDFDGWKENGATIKRHQKGISILEPGDEYTREDGTTGTYYNVKKVFDISQTTASSSRTSYRSFPPKGEKLARSVAPPLPTKSDNFAGAPVMQPAVNVDDRLLLKALIHRPPVPIQMADELPGSAGAVYDHDQQAIFVRRGMEAPDLFRCVSLALARAEIAAIRQEYDPAQAAFPAYCASYMLCKKNGVDVSGYDFSTLPEGLREADAQSIRAVLNEVRDAAHDISARMSRVLEQNKVPRAKEQER